VAPQQEAAEPAPVEAEPTPASEPDATTASAPEATESVDDQKDDQKD